MHFDLSDSNSSKFYSVNPFILKVVVVALVVVVEVVVTTYAQTLSFT